jgi:nucleoside-diphosphate-sugar epimerase
MASSGSGKRIVFTGGSGKAGRHAIPELLKLGHKVLNVDLIPLDNPDVFTLKTDLTDSGQVYNALTNHFDFAGYREKENPKRPDVVVHFAAYARNLLVPDNETFRVSMQAFFRN